MNIEKAAKGYAAVGSESRLAVLLFLVKAGSSGRTVSEIGAELAMAPSTLAHHLRHLVAAGLIRQEKRGREVINSARFELLEELGNYLLHECCKDETCKEPR